MYICICIYFLYITVWNEGLPATATYGRARAYPQRAVNIVCANSPANCHIHNIYIYHI